MTLRQVAELCHEVKRVRRQQTGDYSTPKWCEASETEQELAQAEVRNILKKNFGSVTDVEGLLATGIVLNLENLLEGETVNVI